MRDIDLKKKMRELYITNDYYITIPLGDFNGYEDSYHQETIDPDGVKRLLDTENERKSKLRNFLSEYIQEINILPPGRILDIGCGPGWLLSAIDSAWEKEGVEISKYAATIASQFAKIHNCSIEDFTSNDKFDVITMHHVIEHIHNPIDIIKKVHGLLNDGGIFIIGTPDFDSAMARRFGSKFRLLHDPSHVSLFSNDSMHRFLRTNGFDVYNVEYPYFETDWFNEDDLLRTLSTEGISPPFYGSIMTFFTRKSKTG